MTPVIPIFSVLGRQVYVEREDISKLPEVIQINFENTLYWVYISTKKLTCFLCKEEGGHLAKHCKSIEANAREPLIISHQRRSFSLHS